jgi:hypothetical protein
MKGVIKTFYNKQELKEFMTTKPALHKILQGLLHIDEQMRARQDDARNNKPF